jgi:prephenate dehydrogenase
MFKEIFIIGLGFMGASVAGAVKKKFPDAKIKGFDAVKNNIDYCLFKGIIDVWTDIEKEEADVCRTGVGRMIILCIPPAAIASFVEKHPSFLINASLVTDIGSVKESITINAGANGITNFVGSHPMCGSDKTGPENADFSLFYGKKCIVIKEDADLKDRRRTAQIEKTAEFWKSLGMDVIFSSAGMHDEIAAYASHLPHLIAFLLSDTSLSNIFSGKIKENTNWLKSFIGSGFKDSTRIASSSADLWTDIFLMNGENIVSSLDYFIASANAVKGFIETGDRESLNSYIKKISGERKGAGI